MKGKYFAKIDEKAGLPIYDDFAVICEGVNSMRVSVTEHGTKGIDEGVSILVFNGDKVSALVLNINESRKLRDWLNRRVE